MTPPDHARRIAIRPLLSMTSGLRDDVDADLELGVAPRLDDPPVDPASGAMFEGM